jgi:integrase
VSRHQSGYIYESHGSFHVRYYVEEAGQRKQKSHKLCDKNRATGHGAVTAKAVVMLCEDFMRKINGGVVEQKSLTVVEFWDTIYQPFIESTLKHSTVMGYKQIWNQHLKTHFGNSLMKDYVTPQMSTLLTTLSKTLRPRTLTHIKWLASSIFGHGVATGKCHTNPIRDAIVLGRVLNNTPTQAYTLEEVENIISALVEHVDCQLIMALAFFLGLRKGEIAGLQWGDVDEHVVHVRRAMGCGKVGTPKTRKSTRSVPLIAPVRLLLRLWRQRCRGQVWVFPSHNETQPVSLDRVADRIKPVLAGAGLPWKGYHAGRRGLGTALRTLTGNSNAGRDMLGHSNAQVTEAHYEAAMPDEVLRGVRLLEGKVKI